MDLSALTKGPISQNEKRKEEEGRSKKRGEERREQTGD